MDSSIKNIAIVLVILTFAFLGYYLFIQQDQTNLSFNNEDVNQELFVVVQKYIERRSILDKVSLKTEILNDDRLRSAVSYSTDVVEQPVGRENPFDNVLLNQVNRSNRSF